MVELVDTPDLGSGAKYSVKVRVLSTVLIMSKKQKIELKPLSPKTLEDRKPLPLDSLFDALQDRVHKDVGNARAARTVRSKKNK